MTTTKTIARDGTKALAVVDALDITVLAGGPGVEREVSLDSGQAVCVALTHLGHRVTLCDISPHDLRALDRPADFVFIALHGEFGEDGTLQGILDERGIRYGGSGSRASRDAMDKAVAKGLFQQAGLLTPEYEVVDGQRLDGLSNRFPVPAVVKPVVSGSSVDTSIARSAGDLQRQAAALVAKVGRALIERCIVGPELTVAILGEEALPVCEIRTEREFYDYDAKYVDENTEYAFDIDLPDELLARVRSMSLAAHRALGCRVFSRVDWMVDAATQTPYVLEVNTIPGFTGHSLVPKAAARVGMGFAQLCQRIVELSLREPSL